MDEGGMVKVSNSISDSFSSKGKDANCPVVGDHKMCDMVNPHKQSAMKVGWQRLVVSSLILFHLRTKMLILQPLAV